MDRAELIQRLLATFLDELDEHLRQMNASLLELEHGADPPRREALIAILFRIAHSLKGASRSVDQKALEGLCHRLEELLGALRGRGQELDPKTVSILFATADALTDGAGKLRAKRPVDAAAMAAVQKQVAAQAEAVKQSAPAPAPALPVVATAAPAREPAAETASLRIPASKIDRLLSRGDELLLARRRVEERREEVAKLLERVHRWNLSLKTHRRSKMAASLASETTERIQRLEKDLDGLLGGFDASLRALEHASGALQEDIRAVRMMPFSQACEGLGRTVRDLCAATGKEAELAIGGGEVEIDRAVLERLRILLIHLVRNAIDHGFELPREREAAGKPRRGSVTVSAGLRGGQVVVVVADDGRGIDFEAVRARARDLGLAPPPDDRDLLQLLFRAGFSTAAAVTEVSGRGVGLDVVKSGVEALRGSVTVESKPGLGTRFALSLPLTLSAIRALLVRCGEQLFAIPGTAIARLDRVDPGAVIAVEGRDTILVGAERVPLASLAGTLRLPDGLPNGGKVPAMLLTGGGVTVAFTVDELVAEQEIVVKSLGSRLRKLPLVSGATQLASGRIALILQPQALLDAVAGEAAVGRPVTGQAAKTERRKRILLADDSVTTRTLEKSILEAAGYEVLEAADGQQALRVLEEQGADLVVSDVEMPNLNGFQLTEAIRASHRFRALPVVLVTALSSEEDRARGARAGADAYLVKSEFEQQELLAAVGQLL